MAGRIVRSQGTVRVRWSKPERIENRREDGTLISVSLTSRYTHTTEERVELEVNVDALFRHLAETAARSASGKSVVAGGLVTMRRIGKRGAGPVVDRASKTQP
jgi:hypothetical protein